MSNLMQTFKTHFTVLETGTMGQEKLVRLITDKIEYQRNDESLKNNRN